jgi:gliding motility-associated-like protein
MTCHLLPKYALALFIFSGSLNAQERNKLSRDFTSSSDIFGTRNFVENKGQFQNPINPEEKILFAYQHGGEIMYFTGKSVIYELYEPVPIWKEGDEKEEQLEDLEKEKKGERWQMPKAHYVRATWVSASSGVEAFATEKQSHYFTYGAKELNSAAFKKITFKNVYDHIDFEYSIPADKSVGVKYNVILHPGADPSQVKIAYSGEIRSIKLTNEGDVRITTPSEPITEHAPSGIYENGAIAKVAFSLDNRVISYVLPNDIQPGSSFVIDPWVTAITTLSTNNYGYDVDYDFGGNTYVYGGTNSSINGAGKCKEAKYDATGTLVWTFPGVITSPSWNTGTSWTSNFKVNRGSGKSYLGRNQGGPNIARIDANGNYDNFMSVGSPSLIEVWHVEFDCNGDLMVFGGAFTTYEVVSATTGSIIMTPTVFNANITGCCQDVVSPAFDAQGNVFVYFLGHTQLSNNIVKVAPSFTSTIWAANSGFSVLSYLQNKSLYQSANAGNAVAFNALAVNQNYIFYYDGYNVAAFSKVNGALVGSATTISGHTGRVQGGIAVDDCDNVYVGGNNANVICYNFNGNSFSQIATISLSTSANPAHVYDIQFNKFSKTLYVCGSGFVGAYSAVPSVTCQNANIPNPCSFGANTIVATSNSITCSNLGSATVSAIGGAGPYTYTWLPSGQTSSVANNLAPGNYSVVVYDQGLNFTYTAYASFSPNVPMTGTVNTNGAVPCFGMATASANITLQAGSGNATYVWSNATTTLTAPTATGLSAGTWSVKASDVLTGCVVTRTFSILQPQQITSFVSATTPSSCAGGTVGLNMNVSGGNPPFTFTWSAGANTKTLQVSETVSGNHTYSVAARDLNNCTVTAAGTVTFVPNPTVTVSNSSICPLQTATLVANGATTYTWSTPGNANTFTDNPLSTTGYSVWGETAACTGSTTAAIVLKPVPDAQIASNTPRCAGTMLQLFSGGGSSYVWEGPQSYSNATQNPLITNVGLSQAGVYSMTVTAANGCTAAASTTVVVNTNPTVTANASTVCTTQILNLYSASVPGASYSWTGPNGFVSQAQNPVLANPPVGATGQYVVSVTSTANCPGVATTTALVIPPPPLSAFLSSNSICAQPYSGSPNSVTLSVGGANTYTLTGSSGIQISGNGPYQIVSPFAQNNISYATLTLTGSNGICISSVNRSILVVPNPVISVSQLTSEICHGQSHTYTVAGASAYVWAQHPSLTPYNNGMAFTQPSVTSVFAVTGTSMGCLSTMVNPTLVVHPIPSVSITPVSTQICIGSSATLVAYGSATSYKWLPPNGLNATAGATVLAKPLINQEYYVIGSANNCTRAAATEVRVLPLPMPKATVSTPSLCLNGEVIFTGQGGAGYKWQGPHNISFTGQTASLVASSSIYSGEYTLTVTDLHGCVNSTKTELTVVPLPSGSLVSPRWEECVPFCTEFVFKSGAGTNITASWSVESARYDSGKFTHCFKEPKNYVIHGSLNDEAFGCKSALSYTVRGLPVPVADFQWLPEKPIERLDQVTFENTSKGNNIINWSWFFNQNQNVSKVENPTYVFNDAGSYPVALIVKDIHGCLDTVVKSVTIDIDFLFYIPNAFTPNADKLNEVFKPVVRGAHSITFSVFNRWGEEIFNTTDPAGGWDGTFKGVACKEDVYVYKIRVITMSGEAKEYTGQVTLFR